MEILSLLSQHTSLYYFECDTRILDQECDNDKFSKSIRYNNEVSVERMRDPCKSSDVSQLRYKTVLLSLSLKDRKFELFEPVNKKGKPKICT